MYDAIVIGCGPAGMTAAIFLKRANKSVLILEKETIGGQMASAPLIENYPGFPSILGSELAEAMFEQVSNLGIDFEIEEVKSMVPGDVIEIHTEDDHVYKAKALIIATGAKYKMLPVERAVELVGKGIHFCVSCDGAFYKDKVVAVIGGANSAVGNALMLSTIAKKVYVIHRGDSLKAEASELDKLEKKENVEVITKTNVVKLLGTDHVDGLVIEENGQKKTLEVDGVFVSIGMMPESKIVEGTLDIDDRGFIKSDDTTTKKSGIFIAGDCRSKELRQITIATSDGTIAAINAIGYLNNLE